MAEEKEFKLEEAFLRLQEITEGMEAEDVTLEQSFALYKEGVSLVEKCNNAIDMVEKEVIMISGNGDKDEF